MEPNPGHDSFERINLEGKNTPGHDTSERFNFEGTNTGAAFVIRPVPEAAESDSHHCCCINIYINNNVQGTNNSLLHGSCVEMRDPGVHLFFRDIKFGKSSRTIKKKRKKKESPSSSSSSSSQQGNIPLVLLAVLIPFLLLVSVLCP